MSRYLPLVTDALDEIGAHARHLVIEVEQIDTFVDDVITPPPSSTSGGNIGSSGRTEEEEATRASMALDPRRLEPALHVETFVKGASNQFALAAALRVAETPGRSYNPLFIYGAAGLGKTHLLHAIGHYVSHHYQHDVVRYVSTETFLNEYVDGIPHQHHRQLQAALSRHRRAAHRRHPVHGRQGRSPGEFFTRSTRCTAPTSRSSSRATGCPMRSPRSKSACAAGSSGA